QGTCPGPADCCQVVRPGDGDGYVMSRAVRGMDRDGVGQDVPDSQSLDRHLTVDRAVIPVPTGGDGQVAVTPADCPGSEAPLAAVRVGDAEIAAGCQVAAAVYRYVFLDAPGIYPAKHRRIVRPDDGDVDRFAVTAVLGADGEGVMN